MNSILEKYFYKKYPALFINKDKSMQETCMCWGITCGKGWVFLLDKLCLCIEQHIKTQHETVSWYEKIEKEKLEKGEPIQKRPSWAIEKIPFVQFDQIKEKYGALTIYYSGGDEEIHNMISFAEKLSLCICEECGKFDATVGTTTKVWYNTLCEDCISKTDGMKKTKNWKLLDNNKQLSKLLQKANLDDEKNKGKEIVIALKKIKKIRARNKK